MPEASPHRVCVVVPVFDHAGALERLVEALRPAGLNCWLVDDGSADVCAALITRLVQANPDWLRSLRLATNQGKGAAVMAGCRAARDAGYTHAIQIDADLQHDPRDIARFVAASLAAPDAIISGAPVFDDSIPAARYYGRWLTHLLVWAETLSLEIRDSMCGYRLYPLEPTLALDERAPFGRRMQFDTDAIVRLHWAGVPVVNLPTAVTYPVDGVSHFAMLADNLRMIGLHLRLLAGMVLRSPLLLARAIARLRRREDIRSHWSTIGEAGASGGIWLLYWAERGLGRRAFRILLAPALAYFVLVRPSARRGSIQYLTRVGLLGPRDGWLARLKMLVRHFMSFGETLLDKARVWSGDLDVSTAPVAVDPRFEQALADGRGGVLVVAHFGNLEVLRVFARRMPALRLSILVHSATSARFVRVLGRLNPASSVDLLQVGEMNVSMAAELAERVRGGGWVVIAADRIPLSGVPRTQRVSFLGADADFPTGPWVLASALACPVYWLCCFARAGRYELHCEQMYERIALPRPERERGLRDCVQAFAARLEASCRAEPLQWFNFYPFWHDARAETAKRGDAAIEEARDAR